MLDRAPAAKMATSGNPGKNSSFDEPPFRRLDVDHLPSRHIAKTSAVVKQHKDLSFLVIHELDDLEAQNRRAASTIIGQIQMKHRLHLRLPLVIETVPAISIATRYTREAIKPILMTIERGGCNITSASARDAAMAVTYHPYFLNRFISPFH